VSAISRQARPAQLGVRCADSTRSDAPSGSVSALTLSAYGRGAFRQS